MKKTLLQISLALMVMFLWTTTFGQQWSKGVSIPGAQQSQWQQNLITPGHYLGKKEITGYMPMVVSKKSNNKGNSKAIIFEEDFTGIGNWELPEGWTDYTTNSWDYVYVYDELVNFFRQTDDGEMMLITPEIDFTNATNLVFDVQSATQTSNIPQFEVGIMTDPTDPSTYQAIDILFPDPNILYTHTTYLTTITGSYHLVFREVGLAWDFVTLDNIVITDDPVSANWPAVVTDIDAVPGENGADYAMVSWTNPSTEADGDPLTELDSVIVTVEGETLYSLTDPVIGGDVEVQIDVTPPGYYTFEISAYNSAGSSTPLPSPEIWIGLDTPGPVSELLLNVVNDSTAALSWSPPVEGAHGAWYNGVVDEYKIIKADGEETIIDGSLTSYTLELTTPGTYDFTVVPVNSSGDGTPSVSDAGAFYFDGYLLWEDFWVSVPALDWSIQGEGQSNTWFQFTAQPGQLGSAPEMAFATYWNSFVGESRMVSPVINTTGYEALSLKFDHLQDWVANSYTFKILTTSDNGNTWNEAYSMEVTEDIDAESMLVLLNNEDMGSANFQFAFAFEGNTANCDGFYIDNVRLNLPVEVDVSAKSIFLPDLINPNDVITPQGVIKNDGYLDTDFTATMKFYDNSNTEVYSSVISSTINGGETLPLTFDDWTAVEGEYLAELTVEATGDVNPDNNVTTKDFVVYLTASTRTLVIAEEATGTWCAYCPGAAMGLEDLLVNNWPVAVVAYHSGDDYETTEGLERLAYYEIPGYPTVHFDGIESYVGGSSTESLYDVYWPIVEDRMAIPAPASVEIVSMEVSGNTVNAEILIESDSPINNDSLVLQSVITESHIPESWQNQSELNFVERTMYLGSGGVSVDLSDQTETVSITFDLDDSWDKDNCELAVFVQDKVTKEVLNGNKQAFVTYCDASTTNEDEYIANVLCGDIDNTSGWQGGVADYTDQSTAIDAGGSVDIVVTNGTAWASDNVTVWVDWNNDFVFEQGGEEEFVLENVGGTGESFTGDIVAPDDAMAGDHRMRVRMTYSVDPEPCGNSSYGEVEDYTMTVNGSAALCLDGIYSSGCTFGDGLIYWDLAGVNVPAIECDGDPYLWYHDFTEMTSLFETGSDYILTVQAGYTNTFVDVWIDYNDDAFLSDDELVVNDFECAEAGVDYQIPISIPGDAALGQHTLRYRTNWQSGIVGSCDTVSYGNMCDFTAEITEGTGGNVLFSDDFEAYNVGEQLACQNPDDWTTWSEDPCNATEDPYVSDAQAHSGTNSVNIVSDNDCVKPIENYTTGKYKMSFYIYVPTGADGYWNTLQDFAGASSQWGMQVYFGLDAAGAGSVDAGGAGAGSFTFNYDTWIYNELIVDLNADWAQYYVDGDLIVEWQWSTGSFGTGTLNQLGGNNFYGWTGGVNGNSNYYFDDYKLESMSTSPCENFDALTVGGYVAGQLGDPWSTWSGAPGGPEDAIVSDDYSVSPSNSFTVNAGTIDCIFKFGDDPVATGAWLYSNNIYVPSGYSGYFNVQSEPTPGVAWVMELFFDDGGAGHFMIDGVQTDFTYSQDTWINVAIDFDLDTDLGWVKFDDVKVLDFATTNTIGAIDFYGANSGGDPGAYYDDVCFGPGEPISPPPPPPPPTNLVTEIVNNTDIQLNWDAPGGGPTGSILCVDRDGSSEVGGLGFTDDWQYIEPALIANGFTYDYFEVEDVATQDGPDLATMEQYDIIIWFTGESWQNGQTMTDNDQANLAAYLDNGGHLLLSGQDYFYDKYPSAGNFSAGQFPYDYLGVTSTTQDNWNIFSPDVASVSGVSGSFADGVSFTVQDIYTTAKDGLYIDQISTNGQDLFEVTDPTPAGIGGCQYDGGSFKTVFTSVSLAAIVEADALTTLLGNAVNWLSPGSKELTGYNVYYSYESGPYELLVNTTETSYLDVDPGYGLHCYKVTAVYDDLGESEPTNVACETITGVDEHLADAINVYPNPATDVVNVKSDEQINSVKVYNYAGQIIVNQEVNSMMYQLNTSQYQSGIYFFRIKTDEGIISKRIIVQ